MDINIEKLEELFAEFKNKFGYELDKAEIGKDHYFKFKRKTREKNTHELIIEDHRWEASTKDFNPEIDIGDWLIFSELIDSERDWFGKYINTPYPLTYSEYKYIVAIIQEIENAEKEE